MENAFFERQAPGQRRSIVGFLAKGGMDAQMDKQRVYGVYIGGKTSRTKSRGGGVATL
jgi:hypothetical protein